MWNRRSVSGLSSRLENRTVIILLETSDTRTSPQSPVVDTGTWLRIIFPPVTDKNISRNAASRSNRSRYCRSSYESPGHRFDLPSPASAFFFFFFFFFPPFLPVGISGNASVICATGYRFHLHIPIGSFVHCYLRCHVILWSNSLTWSNPGSPLLSISRNVMRTRWVIGHYLDT